jgi:hypothetical protein
MSTGKITGIVAGAVVVVVLLAVGGWQLGWWLKTSAVNHNAQIFRNSYGAQSSSEQEAQNLVSQVNQINVRIADPSISASEVLALRAQEASIITQTCGIIANINAPTQDLVQFSSTNCN